VSCEEDEYYEDSPNINFSVKRIFFLNNCWKDLLVNFKKILSLYTPIRAAPAGLE
jgi:hypothetical protein